MLLEKGKLVKSMSAPVARLVALHILSSVLLAIVAESDVGLVENIGYNRSEIEIRGIGQCLGRVHIFFNRPYIYFFRSVKFVPEKPTFEFETNAQKSLVNYAKEASLLSILCPTKLTKDCNFFDPNIFFSTFERNGVCEMLVVRADDKQAFSFDMATYTLTDNPSGFSYPLGIPFSFPGQKEPVPRFVYFGKLRLTEMDCLQVNGSSGYYTDQEHCNQELARQKSLPDNDTLMFQADGCAWRRRTRKKVDKLVKNGRGYHYGALLDNKYVIVNDRKEMIVKDIDSSQVFDYYGFKYQVFKSSQIVIPISTLFNDTDNKINTTSTGQNLASERTQNVMYNISFIFFGTIVILILFCFLLTVITKKQNKHKKPKTLLVVLKNKETGESSRSKDGKAKTPVKSASKLSSSASARTQSRVIVPNASPSRFASNTRSSEKVFNAPKKSSENSLSGRNKTIQ